MSNKIIEDSDLDSINNICKSLIGSKIEINYNIILSNGEKFKSNLENINIVGDCMENIIYPFIKSKINIFEKGPKQRFPGFYNRNKNPNFDINNYTSFINQIEKNLYDKLIKTKYLIFKYEIKDNIININPFYI